MKLLSKFQEILTEQLVDIDDFSPYPTHENQLKWKNLEHFVRKSLIDEGEKFLNFQWPLLLATNYMKFKVNGNRTEYETPYFERRRALGTLVMAECAEGKGRFVEDIINGVWIVCEETTWTVPAHLPKMDLIKLPSSGLRPLDLFSADTGALLSWTHYLMKCVLEEKAPEVLLRIEEEIEKRVLNRYIEKNFNWMGLSGRKVNNWNPWINANTLTCFLLIDQNKKRRSKGVQKILASLDAFLDGYGHEGGCEEGPNYWFVAGGMLLEALELLQKGTGGAIDVFDNTLVKNIGRYILKLHIDGNYFVNFADAKPMLDLRGSVVLRYGLRIGDDQMVNFGLEHLNISRELRTPSWYEVGRILSFLFDAYHNPCVVEKKNEGLNYTAPLDSWISDVQVMVTRAQRNTSQGFFLAVKGGNNDESHNHNDVGNFILYHNAMPLIIDVGVGTYTKKTFSHQRYDIWTMKSEYHNVPTINGIDQKNGKKFKANSVVYTKNDAVSSLSMELSGAYPDRAKVKSWRRNAKLIRENGNLVRISESIELESPSDDVRMNFMFRSEPKFLGDSIYLASNNASVKIQYDSSSLSAELKEIKIVDPVLKKSWGDKLYRIQFILKKKILNDEFDFIIQED